MRAASLVSVDMTWAGQRERSMMISLVEGGYDGGMGPLLPRVHCPDFRVFVESSQNNLSQGSVMSLERACWRAFFSARVTLKNFARCLVILFDFVVTSVRRWMSKSRATSTTSAEARRHWVSLKSHRDYLWVFPLSPSLTCPDLRDPSAGSGEQV